MRCPVCEGKGNVREKHRGRSYDQHKRFFAIADAALYHWPKGYPRQPVDIEECRKFLVMKAGWFREAMRVQPEGMSAKQLGLVLESAFRAAGEFPITGQQGDDLVVWVPRSISYDEMDSFAANNIFHKVDSVVIPDLFGCTGEELLEQSRDQIEEIA